MINSAQGVLTAMFKVATQDSATPGTLGTLVTYQRFSAAIYDPQTGDVLPGTVIESPNVSVILAEYDAHEVLPDVVLRTDQKALALRSDLPVTPQTTDCLLIDGICWRVVRIQTDPSGTIWILHIRRESSEGAV